MLKGVKPSKVAVTISTVGGYVVPFDIDDGVYIDDWCIDADILYHRHPDSVGNDIDGAVGVMEYDVNDRVCWKCDAKCPDGIWLAHRLQQI